MMLTVNSINEERMNSCKKQDIPGYLNYDTYPEGYYIHDKIVKKLKILHLKTFVDLQRVYLRETDPFSNKNSGISSWVHISEMVASLLISFEGIFLKKYSDFRVSSL